MTEEQYLNPSDGEVKRRTLYSTLPTLSMSNRTYDLLRWLIQYFLPGVGALYFALSKIWGLPAAEEVVGTIVAVEIFLGLILGISKAQYQADQGNYDGAIWVDESDPERDLWEFKPLADPSELATKKELVFRVQRSQ